MNLNINTNRYHLRKGETIGSKKSQRLEEVQGTRGEDERASLQTVEAEPQKFYH
jgi:hypothetical protein